MAKTLKNKIIVIDDDDIILSFIKVILEDMGYEVSTFDNPTEFIKEKRKVSADLILLDLLMPGISGDVLYKKLRKDKKFKNIPVIFVSSSINVESIAKKYKADGYL